MRVMLTDVTTGSGGLILTLASVLFASITAPLILVFINERARRADRREEAEHRDGVDLQLKDIHTLVNGNLTATLQRELNATVREVDLLKEVLRATGGEPDPDRLAEIRVAEVRISALRAEITERLEQTARLEREGNDKAGRKEDA